MLIFNAYLLVLALAGVAWLITLASELRERRSQALRQAPAP
jgi:hypothetical protein